MADIIKMLPDSVANQIAAGEVVDRPASVVKELIENAVDAGSKNITVNFRDGGKELIQVVDDGCGMSPMDARMAFDRHATSKIGNVMDIYQLGTFGFRGEALASIASIAEVELRTRQESEELGTKIEIAGGKFCSQEPIQTSVGSQFLIRNLFYNVPARRRFLQRSTTEARHITAEYQRVALCNPDIGFTLYDSDALISKLPPAGLRQRIVGVIGRKVEKNLLKLEAETSIVQVSGYVGRPESAIQNNREQFLFVNGRYFRSPYLHRAVIEAYEKLVSQNTQPSYFVYLQVDPEKIDINVHPQKIEVKFSESSEVWQIVNAAVRETLAKTGVVPAMDFDTGDAIEIPVLKEGVSYRSPEIEANPEFNPFEVEFGLSGGGGRGAVAGKSGGGGYRSAPSRIGYDIPEIDVPMTDDNVGVPQMDDDDYRRSAIEFIEGEEYVQSQLEIDSETIYGEILPISRNYFATMIEGSLTIIDIRRAYESVLFDRYMTMLSNLSSASQQLLFPEMVTMSLDDITLLKEHMGDFSAFGFDIKVCDQHTIEVAGLPADFSSIDIEEVIYKLLDTIRQQDELSQELRRKQLAKAMSQMGSASRMREMQKEELLSLMKQLINCENPSYTPKGKPVMFSLTEGDIKKRLK